MRHMVMPADPAARGRIPAAFVQAVLAAYAARGRDAAEALAQARIAPATARNPAARVTPTQFERLCAHAMRELNDEALGWFSRPLPWGSYGMLARASISALTLGLALARWCRHHGLIADDALVTLTQTQGRASVALDERRPLCGPQAPEGQREFARLSLLRNVHGLACWFVDAHIPLQAAEFPGAVPPHADVYATLFPGLVRFGTARAALTFDARYLALPLRRDGAALDQMLRSRALQPMVLPYRRERLLTLRVRQLTRRYPSATAEQLAAQLAVSVRTLHRKLTAEGISLQAIKDQQRRALACDLLLRTRQPLKQVAHAAGFASDKSFARAFHLWTGQTPATFRANHAADAT
jgi:AraC-like DNA-binding protein